MPELEYLETNDIVYYATQSIYMMSILYVRLSEYISYPGTLY